MQIRVPPGHAGRMRLIHRLQVARRGAELLDRKQSALLIAERDLRAERERAEQSWRLASAEARRWLDRATLVDGEARIRLVAAYEPVKLDVRIAERNVMGVRCPVLQSVRLEPESDLSGLGASSTLRRAIEARRSAAEASVHCAIARSAHARVSDELARVARRRRAIEQRWIPAHSAALAQLELSLEESEREHSARVRRLRRATT